MSKKWMLALGAFALGLGAGVGLKALADLKRKCCEQKAQEPELLAEVEEPLPEKTETVPAAESEEEQGARVIRETFERLGLEGDCEIKYVSTPYVIRYTLTFSPAHVAREAVECIDDIALGMASSVRYDEMRGKLGTFALEVARKERSVLLFDAVKDTSENPLEVPLGLGADGEAVYCNLAKMPHLLLAGTTGSGKSVTMTSVLTSLAKKNFPEDLRFVLIDPKMIEFSAFENCPYLYTPIVTSPEVACATLRALVREMERRYGLFRDAAVRAIDYYNEKMQNDPDHRLPYIVVAVDELADLLMSVQGSEIESTIVRLAQKARAAGIHLIIGTQRPCVDVITGKLKSNIPSRIAFMVKQGSDSRTILDRNGAEMLAGRGDMLFSPMNAESPIRVQGVFLSEEQLQKHLGALRKVLPELVYDEGFEVLVAQEISTLCAPAAENTHTDEDPLFAEAVALVVSSDKASTTLLQRRLGIGYGRAARMIEHMEKLALITGSDGNRARKVLPAAAKYSQ